MPRVTLLFILLLAALGASASANDDDATRLAQRRAFLQAEQYLKQNREADFFLILDSLKDYPLRPYLHYQWLKLHLDDSEAVQQFVRSHTDSRYALLLHQASLKHLGKSQRWSTYLQQYQPSDNPELQCYTAQAQFHTGNRDTALDTALRLWRSGESLPSACDGLFALLKSAWRISAELAWQRFEAAMLRHNISLASNLVPLLNTDDTTTAKRWLALDQHPDSITHTNVWQPQQAKAGLLLVYAIQRWSDKHAEAAVDFWDKTQSALTLTPEQVADTEKRLALALALHHDKRAITRLASLTSPDSNSREWRVRTALYHQDWPAVQQALSALTDSEKQQDKWQYWQARALAASGQHTHATQLLQTVAGHRSFHGAIAAGQLQQAIVIADAPLAVSDAQRAQLASQTAFAVCEELRVLSRESEAKAQWQYAISGLDQTQLAVAAKLAQHWQWPSVAIATAAKANAWDDITLRFPLLHSQTVVQHGQQQQVDPAWLYGLIRQESAFDPHAESSAGAKGLMQLLPETAKTVARHSTVIGKGDINLFQPEQNIALGSAYFHSLLKQFNGQYLVATAAYNAGPHRVKQWLPRQALPADVWAETIPYKETRGYVASVLLYALIYQQRLQRNSLQTEELLHKVWAG